MFYFSVKKSKKFLVLNKYHHKFISTYNILQEWLFNVLFKLFMSKDLFLNCKDCFMQNLKIFYILIFFTDFQHF